MRKIKGTLPPEFPEFVKSGAIDRGPAYAVRTYRELMELVAKLAYWNKDHLLFFRGQIEDIKNRDGSSTFYPSIYRGEYLPHLEVINKFVILDQVSKGLVTAFMEKKIAGYHEIKRKKYIQWSILQHYGVCETPLLDFTHSVRVACSFALLKNDGEHGYVYVFGLPYITNRISINSEHDLVNVRLLSICPPDALRPYYQDGYLAGTEDITTNYDSKTELDFKNRLIAKFKIPTVPAFWEEGFSGIPENVLYPDDDQIEELCKDLEEFREPGTQPGEVVEFLKLWANVEEILTRKMTTHKDKMLTMRKIISILAEQGQLDEDAIFWLDRLRRFRNQLVHNPERIERFDLLDNLSLLNQVLGQLRAT